MSEQIKEGKLSEFTPTQRNSNKHTMRGMKSLERSMDEDGYVAPMTAAADGEIIDGDARLETSFGKFGEDALVIHHDGRKPIIMVRDDIPNAEHPMARRIHYRANTVSWQNFELSPEVTLADFEAGFDFSGIGLEVGDLAELLPDVTEFGTNGNDGKDTEPQIDKADELRKKWGVELGQLWQLGEHRLICGDCTDKAVVDRVMGGERATACVTDSPYGMNVDGITNDDEENLDVLFDGVLKCMPIVNGLCVNFQGCRLFWKWIDKAREHKHSIERALWMYKPNDGTYPWRGWLQTGQIIIISSIGKPKWNNKGEYRHDTYVENFVGDELEKMHSTPKPVDIIQHIVSWVSIKSGIVYDPFLGSGATMVAANNLGRRCFGIEIEPSYVAVTLQRYLDHTGIEPVLID